MYLILFFAGIVTWTFLEYMLHRFLGHVHKGRNFFKTEHVVHHSKANYFAPIYKKAIVAAVSTILLLQLLTIVVSWLYAGTFVLGLIGMYCLYEITHYRFHTANPLAMPFIVLRKHHFYHHFHNPHMNHGVTTRFWDRVFKTFQKVDIVKIPRRMSMDWLISDNSIKQSYAKHFQLNSK